MSGLGSGAWKECLLACVLFRRAINEIIKLLATSYPLAKQEEAGTSN